MFRDLQDVRASVAPKIRYSRQILQCVCQMFDKQLTKYDRMCRICQVVSKARHV